MTTRKGSPASRGWRGWADNLGLKLIALAAAVLLFSLVHGAGDLQRSVSVDVVTQLPPASARKMLLSDVPDSVRVTVSGRRAIVQALGREPLAPIQLDLRDPARRFVHLDAAPLDLPAGLRVVQIHPAMLELEWAERSERRLPVAVSLTGTPPEGLAVRGAPRVEPAEVRVVGPSTVVDALTEVSTAPIDLARFAAGSQDLRAPLAAAPAHVTFGDGAPVRVTFDMLPVLETVTLRRLNVAVVGGTARTDMRPARVDVVLRGTRGIVADLDRDVVIPTVTLGEGSAGGGATLRPVEVRGLPEGLEVVSVTPPEVLVASGR